MGDEQRLQVATTVIKGLQAHSAKLEEENAYLKDSIKDLRGAVMKMDDHIRELKEANKQIQEKNVEYQDQAANFPKIVAALMKMQEEDASEMGALELQADEKLYTGTNAKEEIWQIEEHQEKQQAGH